MLVDSLKRRMHRDVVANPAVHAAVLNLYLNGERYPHRVDDYFPIAAAEDATLAASMSAHAHDEDKHVLLYAKAIEKLGHEVVELPDDDIFNHVIRVHTAEPWAIVEGMPADERKRRLAHFLAHAHFLEKRIARSLEYHLNACEQATSDYAGKAVAAVMRDEHRHVGYTRDAVLDLLPRGEAHDVLAVHERAEAFANLDFSRRQMRKLLAITPRVFPRASHAIYRACVVFMDLAHARA